MPNRCCIPLCRTGYGSKQGKNIHLFRIPVSDWEKYKKVIPGKFPKTSSTRICSLHFDESCIEWTSIDSNSRRNLGQRKKPRLVLGSMPTIFPQSPIYSARRQLLPRAAKSSPEMPRSPEVSPKEEPLDNLELYDRVESPESVCTSTEMLRPPEISLKEEPLENLELYDSNESHESVWNSDIPNNTSCHIKEEEQLAVPLPTVAREAIRWGMSDREVAAIVTATLIDFAVVNPDDPSIIVNAAKIRQEKEVIKKEIQRKEKIPKKKNNKQKSVEGISFERMTVLLQVGADSETRRKQERIVLVSQPDGQYLYCITPEGNAEKATSGTIMEFLHQNDLIQDLKVVGLDSIILNSEDADDLLTRIERSRGGKVHRSLCNLHNLEECMQYLLEEVMGPNSIIGKALAIVDQLYWNETFPPILSAPCLPPLESDVFTGLSKDLQYLYLAVASIRSGSIHNQLTELETSSMSRVRSLSQACRICRLYLSQHSLQGRNLKKLNDLTYYIVTNYAPMWIDIKLRPHISEAANHLLRQVQLLRFLPSSTRALVTPFVKSWNAHPENLLVSLLSHSDPAFRDFAIQKILQVRSGRDQSLTSVRPFFPPQLNFAANSIVDLIDWDSVPLYESVLTQHLTIAGIKKLYLNKLELPQFTSHTQLLVERVVAGVSTPFILPKREVDDKKSSQIVVI